MHDETTPNFNLDAVKEAAADKRVVFATVDVQEFLLHYGLDPYEVAAAMSKMTPACFERCEISNAEGHAGEVYDWYLCPFELWAHESRNKARVISMKFEMRGTYVRVWRMHRSKPKREQ